MPGPLWRGFLNFVAFEGSDQPGTPGEQVRALQREHDAAFQAFVKANREAKTEQAARRPAVCPGEHQRRAVQRPCGAQEGLGGRG